MFSGLKCSLYKSRKRNVQQKNRSNFQTFIPCFFHREKQTQMHCMPFPVSYGTNIHNDVSNTTQLWLTSLDALDKFYSSIAYMPLLYPFQNWGLTRYMAHCIELMGKTSSSYLYSFFFWFLFYIAGPAVKIQTLIFDQTIQNSFLSTKFFHIGTSSWIIYLLFVTNDMV